MVISPLGESIERSPISEGKVVKGLRKAAKLQSEGAEGLLLGCLVSQLLGSYLQPSTEQKVQRGRGAL